MANKNETTSNETTKKRELVDEKEEDKLRIKRKIYSTERNVYIFSLWNIWYCLSVLIFNIFLIRKRVYDLINLIDDSTNFLKIVSTFKNIKDVKEHNGTRSLPLPITISTSILFKNNSLFIEYLTRCLLIGLAILFFILFIVTQVRKIGNYANDDFKFGTNFIKEKFKLKTYLFEHQSRSSRRSKHGCLSVTRKLSVLAWRHFLPINSLMHLLNAVAILLPNILFHRIKCFNTLESQHPELNRTMLSCPLNGNTDSNSLNLTNFLNENLFEIINFLIAICLLYIRYSLVFWLANKTLTFLLSLLGLLTCVEQLFQIYSLFYLNIFYFFDNYQHQLYNNNNKNDETMMMQHGANLLLKTKFSINFLYFLLAILVYFSLTPIYLFIYMKYREKYFSEDYRIRQTMARDVTDNNKFKGRRSCFNTYFIHLCAAIQLILICACKIPFCYDYIRLYNSFKDFGIMLSCIVNIICLITFILIWFILTLKVDWKINLKLQFRICHRLVAYDNKNFCLNEILQQIEDGKIEVVDGSKTSCGENQCKKDSLILVPAAPSSTTTTTTTTTTTIATAAILSGFDEVPKSTLISSSPAIISTSTPSSRPHDFIDFSRLAPITRGETFGTNTSTNSNDFSETLYRNEIRKSIKNIMNGQLKKTNNYDSNEYFNRKKMIASGIYLSSSSSSSATTTNNNNKHDLTIISSISDNFNNNKAKKCSITGVGSIKYKPYTRRPVIYLDRRASYTTTQTVATKMPTTTQQHNEFSTLNSIQINKINSNGEIIEFESRV